jgi:hypothetical protein
MKQHAYKMLILLPEGKKQLGRPKCGWEDRPNIKIGLQEIRRGGQELVSSGSGYLIMAGCCEHGNEHSGYIKGLKTAAQLSASEAELCSITYIQLVQRVFEATTEVSWRLVT